MDVDESVGTGITLSVCGFDIFVESSKVNERRFFLQMKKYIWILVLAFPMLLLGCGGGSGVSNVATSSGTSTQPPFVVETQVFSPVSAQLQMSQSIPAPLTNPRLMTIDGGYLYVAAGFDNSVIRIDSNGIQTTLTGFSGSPVGVAVNNGILYVTQTGGLYQLNLNTLSLVNGSRVNVSPQIVSNSSNTNCGNCLGLLFNGNVAYATNGSSTLFTYDTSNNAWHLINLTTPAYGLAMKDGYLSVTDFGQSLNGYVVSTSTSSWSSVAGLPVAGQPYGVAIASNGDIYVASYVGNTVTRIHRGVVDAQPFLDATKVCHPSGLAINDATLFVSSERSSVGCGLAGQSTGYILRATLDLRP